MQKSTLLEEGVSLYSAVDFVSENGGAEANLSLEEVSKRIGIAQGAHISCAFLSKVCQ